MSYLNTYEWHPNKRNRNVLHWLNRFMNHGYLGDWDRTESGMWLVRAVGSDQWVMVGQLNQIEAYVLGARHMLGSRAVNNA